MVIKGLDASSIQGYRLDAAEAKRLGYEFFVLKASGGANYINETLPWQFQEVVTHDMEVAFYHYMFEPSMTSGTADEEFANFRRAVRPYWRPGMPLALDVEESKATKPVGTLLGWILRFAELCIKEFGVPYILLYTGTYFIVSNGLLDPRLTTVAKLWLASWQASLPAALYRKPWDSITVWQYSDDDMVRGVGYDGDEFQGTRQDFRALGTPVVQEDDDVKLIPGSGQSTTQVVNGQLVTITNWGPDERDVTSGNVNTVEQTATVKNTSGDSYNRTLRQNAMGGFVALPGKQ